MKTKFLLILTTIWLTMTATIDFLVLPTAFRVIKNLLLGGNLGIALFSRFNPLEMLFSLTILILMAVTEVQAKVAKTLALILSGLLVAISFIYYFFLTPKIVMTTRVIESLEGKTSEAMAQAQLDHQFFHHLYVRMDSVKLVCLCVILVIILVKFKERKVA